MPTKYKPKLHHVEFDWSGQQARFEREYELILPQLRGLLGGYDSESDIPHETQDRDLVRDLATTASLASATKVEAGFKPVHQIIATIEAIEKAPEIIFNHDIEPEALGMIAQHYQRGTEKPGQFWFDIYWGKDHALGQQQPRLDNVVQAAQAAIAQLKGEAKPGRPQEVVGPMLARRYLEIFERQKNQDRSDKLSVSRHSVVSFGHGRYLQKIGGPFYEFCKLALTPLNEFRSSCSISKLSAAEITRCAASLTTERS